jgi:hypothetical protein
VTPQIDVDQQMIPTELIYIAWHLPPRTIATPSVEQQERTPLPKHLVVDPDVAVPNFRHVAASRDFFFDRRLPDDAIRRARGQPRAR